MLGILWLLTGGARAEPVHYGHPHTWFNRHAPDADQLRILEGRAKHAADVERFFANHVRLARHVAGRAALWQHRRMGRWAERRIRVVRHRMWMTLPDMRDWVTATKVAQRPYPGSQPFLLATSDDEGGRGPWVRHGRGQLPYYPGYERTDGVGGWVQYRPSTFRGHWRHAWDDLRARGFKVPWRLRPTEWLVAWQSPLAQALAAGWACWAHRTGSHWGASGNGC